MIINFILICVIFIVVCFIFIVLLYYDISCCNFMFLWSGLDRSTLSDGVLNFVFIDFV